MAGLSQEQIKMLQGMEGIDQSALTQYQRYNPPKVTLSQKDGGLATAETAVTGNKNTATDVSSGSVVDEVSSLEAALNVAIDEGRKQRKDTTLDFMNGVVPPGALPATSFASILESFNADSAPLESALVKSAVDFQRDKIAMAEQKKNDVRDFGIAAMQAGASTDIVNSIIALAESGDIDAAMKIGAPAIIAEAKAGTTRSVKGNSIVETDKEGNEKVLYTMTTQPPEGKGYDIDIVGGTNEQGQEMTGPNGEVQMAALGPDERLVQVPYRDYTKVNKDEALAAARKLINPQIAEIIEGWSAFHVKAFMNGFLEIMTITRQWEDPQKYMEDYARRNYLDTTKPVEEKKDGEKKDEEEGFESIFPED